MLWRVNVVTLYCNKSSHFFNTIHNNKTARVRMHDEPGRKCVLLCSPQKVAGNWGKMGQNAPKSRRRLKGTGKTSLLSCVTCIFLEITVLLWIVSAARNVDRKTYVSFSCGNRRRNFRLSVGHRRIGFLEYVVVSRYVQLKLKCAARIHLCFGWGNWF